MPSLARPVFVLLLLLAVGRADEVLERIQRELRARKYYFGEVDGRFSEETMSAVQAFQKDKGLDCKGPIDEETLAALGLRDPGMLRTFGAEERKACSDWIVRYWHACERGDWEQERDFYSPKVKYFDDGLVDRAFIRRAHLDRYARWPTRKYTILNRYVSLLPGTREEAIAIVWMRTEATNRTGTRRVLKEEIRLGLRRVGGEWLLREIELLGSWPGEGKAAAR